MPDVLWTAEQAAAIQSLEHTLLEANAGTGKTTTVVGAILWRLGLDVGRDERGSPIPPCAAERRLTLDRVAAITFTEKAAYDLKRKLRTEIERRAPHLLWELDRAAIGTIHSFCGDVLKEHALRFGIDPSFTVLDEREALLELEELGKDVLSDALDRGDEGAFALLERYKRSDTDYTTGALGYMRQVLRDLRWHPDRWARWGPDGSLDRTALRDLAREWTDKDDAPVDFCDTLLRLARDLDGRWARWLAEELCRDYDALILDLRDLLARPEMAPALAALRRRFGLLVIDEFQDTDGAQRDIAFSIARLTEGPDGSREGTIGPQLFLVGDPKQSIYRFRGADVSVWSAVDDVFAGRGTRLKLTRNFRSDPTVVAYVNRACEPALRDTGSAVVTAGLASRVPYVALEPARSPSPRAGVQWLWADARKVDDRRELEARMVAARIRDIVVDEARGDASGITIVDSDTGAERPCRYRDVAVLFRTRTSVGILTRALEGYGVPYYLAGDAGLRERLEVLDVLTLLRLLENPLDDLRAFAFLRSPFVGLRDEVIARIRLDAMYRPLIHAAGDYVESEEWFAAPEHARVSDVERESLANGLAVIEELSRLPSRVPIHRLAEEAIERTGYRLHLLLLPEPESRLANLERFLALLEGYRNQTVGTFLEIWDRWDQQDLGVPQAALYSKDDDVVTLSTVHTAKGLEWPVVFLVDSSNAFSDRSANAYWSDRDLGPVLCPKQNERGSRTSLLQARDRAEETAEEARLMYVALTRARDRLIVTGPTAKAKGMGEWLGQARDAAVTVTTEPPEVEIAEPPPSPSLSWLDDLREEGAPPLVRPVRAGPVRRFRSATEIMTRLRSRKEWRHRYVYGVEPVWWFARRSAAGAGTGAGAGQDVPPHVRGVVIHGVLERIREEHELEELLDVAIGALDQPELEERLAPGTAYREALEAELRRVVASDEWRWYVEGEHWRELWFVHFRSPTRWRVGAFDLYRRGRPRDLIVDFKTHDVEAAEVARVARDYAAQVAVYRGAARAAGTDAAQSGEGGDIDVRLHFTRPNVVWRGG